MVQGRTTSPVKRWLGIDDVEPEDSEDQCDHEDADETVRESVHDTGLVDECGIRAVYRIRTTYCCACLQPLDQSFERLHVA